MAKYRKAIVAAIAGLIGAAGVAVAVTADNHVSLNDVMAMIFAGLQAVGSTVGVALVSNEPAE
jgi:hypothetical protein